MASGGVSFLDHYSLYKHKLTAAIIGTYVASYTSGNTIRGVVRIEHRARFSLSVTRCFDGFALDWVVVYEG